MTFSEVKDFINTKIKSFVSNQNLTFDEYAHKYTINGQPSYSTTTVLNQIGMYKMMNIPQSILMHKARIGTMVHSYAEIFFDNANDLNKAKKLGKNFIDKQDPLGIWGDEYRQDVDNYASSVDNWFENRTYELISSEIKVCSPEDGLAGTADLLLARKIVNDGVESFVFTVGDWKTSASIDTHTQPLQLYSYARMINKILGSELFTHGLLIQLGKDGKAKEYLFDLSRFKDRWDLLLNNFNLNIKPIL